MNSYEIGNAIYLQAQYREDGVLVDPTSPALSVQAPGGSSSPVSPTHDSLGTYNYYLVLDTVGIWNFRWTATDPKVAQSGAVQCTAAGL